MDSPSEQRRVPPLPGEIEAMNEPERTISLAQILKVFDDGIKEEQTWAVTYQTVKEMKERCTPDRNPPKSSNRYPLRCPISLDKLLITSHGRCYCDPSAPLATDNREAILSLGETLFECLDYGLDKDQERDLSSSLSNLIQEMHGVAEDPSTEDVDAGMDEDSYIENLDTDNYDTMDFDHVLDLCRRHIGRPERADSHFEKCTRALVANAIELSRFLEKITTANATLRELHHRRPRKGRDPNLGDDLEDLDTSAWAALWMNVMKELRNGVTLRNCEKRHSPIPKQYEMTPYEMLMSDIKKRNWNLQESPLGGLIDGELPTAIRNDAHEIIMEFIRSRPPLVPSKKRHLKPKPIVRKSFHDMLMDQIRKPSSRALLNSQAIGDRFHKPYQLGWVCDTPLYNRDLTTRSTSSPTQPNPERLQTYQAARGRHSDIQANSTSCLTRQTRHSPKLHSRLIENGADNRRHSSAGHGRRSVVPRDNVPEKRGKVTRSNTVGNPTLGISQSMPRSRERPGLGGRQRSILMPTVSSRISESDSSVSLEESPAREKPRKADYMYDVAMDIEPQQDFRQPVAQSVGSRQGSGPKRVVPLDSWSSASSSRHSSIRSSLRSPKPNDMAQIYVNKNLVESCGNLLGKTQFSDDDEEELFADPKERSRSSSRKNSTGSQGDKVSSFFKRSYTVHGLSSAARKIRRSFNKKDSYEPNGKASPVLENHHNLGDNTRRRSARHSNDSTLMSKVMPKSVKKMKQEQKAKKQVFGQEGRSVDVSRPEESHDTSITMHHMWAHPVECLSLKLHEVKQIRVTLTEGDIEKFRHQKTLHANMQKGKICFVCKIRKFGLFTWSYRCPLCDRNVCYRCLRKGIMPQMDAVSQNSTSSADEYLLNLPAHAVKIQIQENQAATQDQYKNMNAGEFKVCLDCAEMLNHIKDSSDETIQVAHAFQQQLRTSNAPPR